MGKRPKYGNKKTVFDGIKFDSSKEARRYSQLKLLQRAGEISDLKLQVPFILQGQLGYILTPTGRKMLYKADFTYIEGNKLVIEDVKGFRTKEYLLKKAILAAMGITIRET